MKDLFIVEPIGGLCNRIRVINSAIFLAKDLQMPLTVIWRYARGLNCSIYELWQQPYPFEVIEYRNFNVIKKEILNFKFRKAFQIPQSKMTELLQEGFDFKSLSKHKSLSIKTWDAFYPQENFTAFRPLPQIQARIDHMTRQFDTHTVGVHIRRTDHVDAIQYSSTEKFIAGMAQEIREHPKANFFLATDSEKEEELFKHTFGDKIMTYSKELKRNSQKGIQDALVDLMCLAHTQKIFGSYTSSFSEIASQWHNIPLHIVR